MEEEKQMSFLDHLEELRWRLVRSAIAIVIVAVGIWVYQEWIMDHVFLSMNSPQFFTFQKMCEWFGVCVEKIDLKMQSTEVSGQFSYALMMSIIGGVVVSFPFIFFQFWSFVKPGLRQNEKSAAKGIIFYVSLLFFLGIGFGYYVVAPLCIQFFGNYKMSESIENIFTVSSYMSMVLSTVFYSGLLFLLPVVSFILTKLGIITPEFLRKYRKHAIVGVLVLSALITPPDLISQVIVAIPITLLYEIGILVSKRAEKKLDITD
ncbi:MAG: twin-arginine translocase subunit TatC [Crocinitomicaceae bacterium]|jgi:sec-independent protein translocase protein TatC|nr:twin-arginine translocase subunit TatC [Crocinitomicaceae bacterium]